MLKTDLFEVMCYIGEHYVFTPEQYPALCGMSGEQRRAFFVQPQRPSHVQGSWVNWQQNANALIMANQ
jgi:hypothetical protein